MVANVKPISIEEVKLAVRDGTVDHDLIWRAMSSPELCRKCYGCGEIASDDDQSSWLQWLDLPPGSDLAVRMGFVHAMPCPDCGGTGEA